MHDVTDSRVTMKEFYSNYSILLILLSTKWVQIEYIINTIKFWFIIIRNCEILAVSNLLSINFYTLHHINLNKKNIGYIP